MKKVIVKHTRLYEKKISNLMDLDKRQTFENDIAKHPTFHPVVPGTGSIRKARIALEGRGKRGGQEFVIIIFTRHRLFIF